MNKYEIAYDDLASAANYDSETLQELIDKDKNGIYILKEDTRKLLEVLEDIELFIKDWHEQIEKNARPTYYAVFGNNINKLRNALGGDTE